MPRGSTPSRGEPGSPAPPDPRKPATGPRHSPGTAPRSSRPGSIHRCTSGQTAPPAKAKAKPTAQLPWAPPPLRHPGAQRGRSRAVRHKPSPRSPSEALLSPQSPHRGTRPSAHAEERSRGRSPAGAGPHRYPVPLSSGLCRRRTDAAPGPLLTPGSLSPGQPRFLCLPPKSDPCPRGPHRTETFQEQIPHAEEGAFTTAGVQMLSCYNLKQDG